jgi:ribosomal protein S18 acetylase RimI-like enzyme
MIHYEKTTRLTDILMAKKMLDSLENLYPGFQYWFINKCMPGILIGQDILVVAKEHGQIVGVALGKKREGETKLRCLRVLPSHQSRGIAWHLTDWMLRELNHDKPHCTVSEEMFHLYSRAFINRYRFDVTSVEKGLYRPRVLEYIFNAPKVDSLSLALP